MKFPFRTQVVFLYHLLRFANRYKEYSIGKRISIMFDYLRLYKRQRLLMSEYYEYEFEKQTKEFRDTFLGWSEQGYYLNTLNPVKYYTLARNKYLAHLCLEKAGIPMPELLGYYNPYQANADKTFAKLLLELQEKGKAPFVIKATESSHGEGVYVVKSINNSEKDLSLVLINDKQVFLKDVLKYRDELIVESLIKQSKQLSDFNKTSVNTVRFMTCLYPNGEAKVIATFIKIGRDGAYVDNAGAGGNVDAGIDVSTGKIYNPIVFSGFRKTQRTEKHPDSNVQLNGVIIRDWDEIKAKVIGFQQSLPYVKAAGWDVAITDDGPVVIEVNDSWDRTGQLFIGAGWKDEIKACFQKWSECAYKYNVERWTVNIQKDKMKEYRRLFHP